jgi:hypothetical protein
MSVAYVFILISLVAVAVAFAVLAIFGVRNLGRGKHSKFSVGAVIVPFVVFGVCIPITGGDYAKAAILTVIIMAVIAIIGLVYSGVRGLTG